MDFGGELLKAVAELLEVAVCGFQHWVAHKTFAFADVYLALHFGHFLFKLFHYRRSVDRVNIYCNIKNFV